MYTVMTRALEDSINKTKKDVQSVSSPWNTVVVSTDNENSIIIPTGKSAGLQVGDEFEIYNVTHHWKGQPCQSEYLLPTVDTSQPIAIATVEDAKDLAPNAARLRIKERLLSDSIEQGAYVYIHQLTSKRTLLRSVAIQNIEPFKIEIQGENVMVPTELDLTSYLKSAVGPVLKKAGFYIKPMSASYQF